VRLLTVLMTCCGFLVRYGEEVGYDCRRGCDLGPLGSILLDRRAGAVIIIWVLCHGLSS
jgi:hypothetical protein